jgi:hypothetical protein
MAADVDFYTVTPSHTQQGKLIVWQVSLQRIIGSITCMTDWRDFSVVHGCVLEVAYQAQLRHATLPAPHLAEEGNAERGNGGDWVVDLEQLIQVNTQTLTRRVIRRSVITGSWVP